MIRNSRIFRYINKNIKKIITIIIVIIFALLLIQVANLQAKEKSKDKVGKNENYNENIYKPEETVIIGDNMSKEEQITNQSIINRFVEFCNSQNPQEAYNMLSKECKEVLYQDYDTFVKSYYQKIFNTKREISIQSWINMPKAKTYKVRFLNDALASGKLDNDNLFEDYITIVKENGIEKLNIGSYIQRSEINQNTEEDGVKITVSYIDYYMTHESYRITVENNTQNSVFLDSKKTTESIYLTDENEIKWKTSINYIANPLLEIKPNLSQSYVITFFKAYNPDQNIESITFSDIRQKQINNEENIKSITIKL